MYESFYGLSIKPFRMTPDPAFLFRSRSHEEALARMELSIEDRGVMLLVGEIGSGKTTLSRVLIDAMVDAKPVLIVNPVLSPNQFLRTLALRLGAETPKYFKADLVDQVNELIYNINEQGEQPVIIIDEAQLIPGRATFEEIRLLTNFQLDDRNLMTIILMGQPEVEKRMARKEYRAFTQRITMKYTLKNLDQAETDSYIDHRLKVAGGNFKIFDKNAKEMIYIYSGGVPRRINNLAGNALLEGFGRQSKTIGRKIVQDAANDLGFEPLEMAVA